MTTIDPSTLVFRDGRPQVVVDPETSCWIWQGYKCRGYGRLRVRGRPSVQAHRAIYERIHGAVGPDLDMGHVCHRRSCVNPTHVRPVTKETNNIERYEIPTLGAQTIAAIEEDLLDDKPHGWIQDKYGISHWSIRRIASRLDFRDHYSLEGIPF